MSAEHECFQSRKTSGVRQDLPELPKALPLGERTSPQGLDGEGLFCKKHIDKTHKNRYILWYKCEEKECASRAAVPESRGR